MALSVLHRYTTSGYLFCYFSVDHGVVCPSSIYNFWLSLLLFFCWSWRCLSFIDVQLLVISFVIFLLTMVLSVLHRYTTSGYLFCYFSVNHGVVCPSSIYNFWLSLLLFFCWSWRCLSFIDIQLLVISFVIFLLIMALSVLHRCTTSGYLFCYFSVNHGVVCPSSIYNFWLSLLLFFCWSWCCLSFIDIHLLVISFVIFLLTMVLSVLHRCTTSGYLFCYFSVDHGVVCPSSIYNFWLSLLLFFC